MDIHVSKIFDSEEDSWVFSACEDYIVASRYFDSENLCRVRLITVDTDIDTHININDNDNDHSNSNSNKRKHQQDSINTFHEWNLTGVTDLTDIIAIDATNKFVFIAHRDSKNISAFSLDATNNNRSRKTVAVNFKADYKKILPLNISGVNAMAVLSETGELSILRISPDTFDVTSVNICALSFSGTSLSSISLRDSNVLVLTDTSNIVRLVRVDYHDSDDEFRTHEFPTIQLPATVASDPLLGCVVKPKCIFALYGNGELHAYKSPNERSNSIMDWWPNSDDDTNIKSALKLDNPTSTNYLKQSVPNRASKRMFGVGGLSHLGDSYIVAAYGKFLSIWDATYLSDHALVDLGEHIRQIKPSSNVGTLLCQSQSKVFALEIEAVGAKNVLSLAEAIKRKGSCGKILGGKSGMKRTTILQTQPVVTKWLKSAADASASMETAYMQELEKLEKEESKIIAQISSRDAVADGEELYNRIETYLLSKDTLKCGMHGDRLNLGLSQLPSINLSAKAFSRCLIGIREKNWSFLKPLIDLCGTSAISYHAILSELKAMTVKLNTNNGNLNSIANHLLFPDCTLGIEAVLISIPDIPESDVVRFAQFAVRMHKNYKAQEEKTKVKSAAQIFKRGQLKMHRLVLRCMVAKHSHRQLLKALQEISIADVKAFLKYFLSIIEEFDTRKILEEMKTGKKKKNTISDSDSEYRGAGQWLDKSFYETAGLESKEIGGCINWACCIIDGHMASLLLDKDPSTRQVLKKLLALVKTQRKCSEEVVSVIGSLEHIHGELPLPKYSKPYKSYKVTISNEEPLC